MKRQDPNKRPVTVFLDEADFDCLTEICVERKQSRADFLRAAISVHPKIPNINTRPLVGVCLQKRKARLKREKQEKAKKSATRRKG